MSDDLRFCRQGIHSYFGPICTQCGHDLMRQINGESCGQYCRIHNAPAASESGKEPTDE